VKLQNPSPFFGSSSILMARQAFNTERLVLIDIPVPALFILPPFSDSAVLITTMSFEFPRADPEKEKPIPCKEAP
jgi:hypothetical protein